MKIISTIEKGSYLDKRLGRDFFIPWRATAGSAGYDVFAAINEPVVIKNYEESRQIPLGFALDMEGDKTTAAFLMPRSGLGTKGVMLANTIGLIDSDYQGEVYAMVYLRYTYRGFHEIKPGDRIAQLVFQRVEHPVLEFADSFAAVTDRGDGGFGSTGI